MMFIEVVVMEWGVLIEECFVVKSVIIYNFSGKMMIYGVVVVVVVELFLFFEVIFKDEKDWKIVG